ncbi:2-haloacid dehalogenase [Alteribacillus persepolensis]|uniref:2-haloacid dehalogenase n=1 Tax=Alteribacillus persepolensis TaxID=568899 RepID=A0A1G7Z1N5_9BACI|nr:haloacid dehalogenase type II [Alteribacillus persepolensis]SDH02623.1 2-haloacid dehalogenase [Alteribacillus persepolensis]
MNNKVFVFDVYGTLFDVHSTASDCNRLFPGYGEQLAAVWRDKQIQYTFLRQAMGKYQPFSKVTRDALRYAAAFFDQTLQQADEEALMKAYQSLQLFSETRDVLKELYDQQHSLLVFSNGTKNMLHALLHNGDIASYMSHILSVDDVKQYKPSPASYQLILDYTKTRRDQIYFVSSNGWDVSGAKAFGFTTIWINRNSQPVEGLQLPPDATYKSLTPLADN